MSKTAFVLKITNPAGGSREIPVKPSLSIRMEEQLGVPIWQRVSEGYTGAFARFGYEVGRDNGFIPASLTFDEFVDADPEWVIDIVSAGSPIPQSVDATSAEEAAETSGN